MQTYLVPVTCFENAVDALTCGRLRTGPPLPRTACAGSRSVSYPVFVVAESRLEAGRKVRDVLPVDGYEVSEAEPLSAGAPV